MELKPYNVFYVFINWIIVNLFIRLSSIGIPKIVVRYDKFQLNPLSEVKRVLPEISRFSKNFDKGGPFNITHLVAGNKIRMGEKINIRQTKMASTNLTLTQARFAKVVDFFFT